MALKTFLECFRNWRVPPDSEEKLAEADVIVTHGFGNDTDIGVSNRAIVGIGVALAKRFGKPMICQYPGSRVAEEVGIKPVHIVKEHLLKPGLYVDTQEVNRQIADVCKAHGWHTAVLVAHPHHVWRAKRNLAHNSINALAPDTSTVPYDPHVDRWQLHWPWFFVWDFLARMKYLREGLL